MRLPIFHFFGDSESATYRLETLSKLPPPILAMLFWSTFFKPPQKRPQNGENYIFIFCPEKQ